MPDQPDDPIHYEMKIPPEPKHNKDSDESNRSEAEHRGSDEVTGESNDLERTGTSPEDARRHVPSDPARQR